MQKLILLFLCFLGISNSFSQKLVTTIPFELKGHTFIKVVVDNSDTLNFVFDSGTGKSILLDQSVVEKLQFENGILIKTTGNLTDTLRKYSNHTLKIGNITLTDVSFIGKSLSYLGKSAGVHIDGIIGEALLGKYITEINQDTKTISFYEQENFVYKGKGKEVKLKTIGGVFYIKSEITLQNGEKYKGRFIIDNGSGDIEMILSTPFVNKKNLKEKVGKTYETFTVGISGKRNICIRGYIKNVNIGNALLSDVPIILTTETYGALSLEFFKGLIGGSILERFNITYDLKNKKMYMEPASKLSEKFVLNCSGIHFEMNNEKTKISIFNVIANSPASEAKMLINDEIIEVNGVKALEYGAYNLKQLLKKEGETVDLLLKRNNETFKVSLKLRKLN